VFWGIFSSTACLMLREVLEPDTVRQIVGMIAGMQI